MQSSQPHPCGQRLALVAQPRRRPALPTGMERARLDQIALKRVRTEKAKPVWAPQVSRGVERGRSIERFGRRREWASKKHGVPSPTAKTSRSSLNVHDLLAQYGCAAVFCLIDVERLGIPLPCGRSRIFA